MSKETSRAMADPPASTSPVMDIHETARYLCTTPNALRIRRHRRTGPPSFLDDAGRILYFRAEVDAYLAASARADSRSNPDLNPLNRAPEPRRAHKQRAGKAVAA